MGMLFGFLPFIGFAMVDRFAGSTMALLAAAGISSAIILRDLIIGKSPKILEIGALILFACYAAYALFADPVWSLWSLRLLVDLGMLAIVLVSIAIRQPFTIQYAREMVPPEFWHTSEFRKTNYVISAVWALAFLIMVAADALLLFVPEVPRQVGVVVTIAALAAAIKFTRWYPERVTNAA
jgi:hypothetical protein